jgi:CRP-like cAMP-binding protein
MERVVSRIEKIRDGCAIIKEDTWPYYTYILKDGRARILKEVDGKQVNVGTLIKGDVFGEAGFLGEEKRAISVIADGDVTVEMINNDTLSGLLDELPQNVRVNMCVMVNNLTSIVEIYSRLVVFFQNMEDNETKMPDAEIFEMEIEEMHEFMARVAMSITRRYAMTVDRFKKLAVKLGEKEARSVCFEERQVELPVAVMV